MKANIKIEFFSYWHCGSGISGGADSDALVKKDENGLPFVPGKTLKGHLREAAEWLYDTTKADKYKSLLNQIFGQENKPGKTGDDMQNGYAGEAYFTNLYVHPEVAQLIEQEGNAKSLFTNLYSTAIDEQAVAKKGSLRSIEAAIPLTLYGRIDNLTEEQYIFINKCTGMVKELGSGKTRGLGRCKVSLIN
jgi:CRISPR/Cas system CSM-associated protein Csm3 (group 7 of RAMP superfamily)